MRIDNASQVLKTVKSSYDCVAQEFSASRQQVWPDLQVFLNYIHSGDKILDLGCGNGRAVSLFSGLEIAYLGLDNSAQLIESAKQNFPDQRFEVADALELNLTEKFDAVLSLAVLNHIPTHELQLKFLQNALTALKPNGYLFLSNWNLWNEKNKKGVLAFNSEKEKLNDAAFSKKYGFNKEDLALKDVLTVWGDQKQVLYYYAFEVEELELLVREAGFTLVEAYYSSQGKKSTKDNSENIILIGQRKE